jgi:hypothetical protein
LWAGYGHGALCQQCHRQGRTPGRARFITDFGEPIELVEMQSGESMTVPRYGVWGDTGHWTGKAQVLAVSDDLDALQAEYGPDLLVHRVPKGSPSRTWIARGQATVTGPTEQRVSETVAEIQNHYLAFGGDVNVRIAIDDLVYEDD